MNNRDFSSYLAKVTMIFAESVTEITKKYNAPTDRVLIEVGKALIRLGITASESEGINNDDGKFGKTFS